MVYNFLYEMTFVQIAGNFFNTQSSKEIGESSVQTPGSVGNLKARIQQTGFKVISVVVSVVGEGCEILE